MTAFVELYMDQGSTFRNVINLNDDRTNAPINVAGYTITSKMRPSYYSSMNVSNITCVITDAANGVVVMSMEADQTSNIKPGKYVFDVKSVDLTNNTSRLLEGHIIVLPQSTK